MDILSNMDNNKAVEATPLCSVPHLEHSAKIIYTMPIENDSIQKRTEIARSAIKAAYGTEDDEYGATLFVSHHLDELEPAYWQQQFHTTTPEPNRILDALILRSEFEEDDSIDSLDFTLPGDVTNYVLCVTFDDDGEVDDISMES